MSYAVIVQSAVHAGSVRQTAIVPVPLADRVRIFTRLGSGNRGSAGAWKESMPIGNIANERLVGYPTSVAITDNDWRDLGDGASPVPSVLLQKLVRKVANVATLNPDSTMLLEPVIDRLKAEVLGNPDAFAVYQSAGQVIASTPAVQVVHQPAPVVQPATVSAPTVFDGELMQFTTPQVADPDVSVYIPRDIDGHPEVEVYDFARAGSEAVAIDGHAGTGKTTSAKHYSAVRGLPFLRLEMNQSIDTSVTQGKFVPDGVGGLKWVYSPLAQLIQRPSVILLNEFTRTSAKNASLFLGLLEERQLIVDSHQGEVIPVHPEALFVIDYNSGYRGTVQIDQAMFDRFKHKWKFSWSDEAERVRIPSPALREFANALRKGAELEDKYSTPISTRLLLNFVKQAQGLSLRYAVGNLLNAFPAEEQDAVKMLLAVYSANIASELNVSLDGVNL
jgi:hypothetical protein